MLFRRRANYLFHFPHRVCVLVMYPHTHTHTTFYSTLELDHGKHWHSVEQRQATCAYNSQMYLFTCSLSLSRSPLEMQTEFQWIQRKFLFHQIQVLCIVSSSVSKYINRFCAILSSPSFASVKCEKSEAIAVAQIAKWNCMKPETYLVTGNYMSSNMIIWLSIRAHWTHLCRVKNSILSIFPLALSERPVSWIVANKYFLLSFVSLSLSLSILLTNLNQYFPHGSLVNAISYRIDCSWPLLSSSESMK